MECCNINIYRSTPAEEGFGKKLVNLGSAVLFLKVKLRLMIIFIVNSSADYLSNELFLNELV